MLISTLENLLNRGLPRSPRARQLCAELSGKKVAVNIRGLMRLVVASVGDSLAVSRDSGARAADDAASVDAEISGGPLALLRLIGSEPEAAIQQGEVQIQGDIEVSQKFRELALLLRPDIEEELALLIGDTAAHQLGRFARSALDWGRRAADTTTRNVSEFLAHERGDLVSRPEGNQFLKGVDAVREDVDRLEARFELIRQRAQARSTPPSTDRRGS
jgi:ubiquinone biosynthesis protein UbiJ